MFDIQLVAVAAAVLVAVVILVTCFLFFGNRERSFEDALAEREGLNILLSDKANGDHAVSGKKHGAKDAVKKKKPVASTVVKEQAKKSEKPKTEAAATGSPSTETSKPSKINGAVVEHISDEKTVEAVDVALGNGLVPTVEDQAAESQQTKLKPKKQGGKKEKIQKHGDELPGKDVEISTVHAASPASDDVKVDSTDTKVKKTNEKLRNASPTELPRSDKSAEPPLEVPLQASVVHDVSSAPADSVAMKKKKSKAGGSGSGKSPAAGGSGKSSSKSPDAAFVQSVPSSDFVDSAVFDNSDASINATLLRLDLPTLSDAQQSVIAVHYKDSGSHMSASLERNLKKKLEEKDHLLAQENQKLSSAYQTVKDLNQEVLNEKQRCDNSERNFKEQLVLLQSENQNMAQKLRDYQNQMTSKLQSFRQMEAQVMQFRSMEQNNGLQAQQIREENQRLKERMAATEQEMLTRNAELHRLKQELMNRDGQVVRLEQQHKEFDQMRAMQDANLTQQLMECKNELITKEQECSKLDDELKILRNEFILLDQDHKLMRRNFEEQEIRVQSISHQQATEKDSKQEMDRYAAEFEELKRAYDAETTKHEKFRAEMDHELARRLREKDDHYKHILSERDANVHKLHDEVQQLKREIEHVSQTKNQTEDARYKELEHVLNAKNKLDAEISQLRCDLDATCTKLKERENVVQNLQRDLESVADVRQKAEESLKALKVELENTRALANGAESEQIGQLKQQIDHLDGTLSRRNAAIKTLEDQVKLHLSKANESEHRICDLTRACDSLSAENQSLMQQLKSANQNGSLVNGHTSEVAGVVIDPELLKVNERSMTQLSKQLINKDVEIAHLKEQIEMLREKSFALRGEKYKAVEAVVQMEKNVKELVDKSESKVKEELLNLQKETRDKLSRCLPNYQQPALKDYKEWLCDYEANLKNFTDVPSKAAVSLPVIQSAPSSSAYLQKEQDLCRKINDLSRENVNLRSNCESLKGLLVKTEKLLASLENSPNSHEISADSKNIDLEKQMNQLKHDTCYSLNEQLKSSAQVQSQLQSFKTLLEREKLERDALLKQIEERNILLENEKSSSKDLSAQTVKLRGMVKMGQDALKQEQELVNQLQIQLKALQNDKGGREIFDEIEELRKRLQQRDHQLEREMGINKQLNNKLASLGVSTPFGSVSS